MQRVMRVYIYCSELARPRGNKFYFLYVLSYRTFYTDDFYLEFLTRSLSEGKQDESLGPSTSTQALLLNLFSGLR